MPDHDFREAYRTHSLPGRASSVMTRGNTRSTLYVAPSPPYAVRGEGCLVTDQLGHQVIDANNNYTALIHGHSRPEIVEAVTEQLQAGTAFGLPTESEVALAELLAARTGHPTWRFSCSGTEAVMTAVRAARAFTRRDVLVRFEGSYHGTTDSVVSSAAPGITAGTRGEVVEVPQGNRAAFDAAVAEHGSRIAAVLIDLMPNRAGLVPAEPDFVAHVQTVTQDLGALLVVDEVISLRVAEGGLASEYGVQPDLITAGKIIGGGFPVGAVGGRADVLALFDPFDQGSIGWGGTFSANPVTMTAGRVAMDLFDGPAVRTLNRRGDDLREALLAAGVAVSGRGSLIRLLDTFAPGELWWAAYERGVLVGTNGLLALSTAMDADALAQIERVLVDAVTALRAQG